jgi:putative lipoic acid-binding regulatory protein
MESMTEEWASSFREKLDKAYVWPSLYIFKFIVPQQRVEEVKELFPNHTSTEKQSENGKYISVTFNMMMPSSEAVVTVYQKVQHIEGLIAL